MTYLVMPEIRNDKDYIRAHRRYAHNSNATALVLEHMLSQGIGERDLEVHLELAVLYDLDGNFDKAYGTFKRALKIFKTGKDVDLNYSHML
jgi:hypothetical protein